MRRSFKKESGTEALTLRKLAQRLGVSHMAPYRHFSDKDALLAAIAATGFRQLKSRLERAGSAAAPNGSSLLREGTAYVKFALDEPAMFRPTRPTGQYDELDAARAEAFDVLIGGIPADLHVERRLRRRITSMKIVYRTLARWLPRIQHGTHTLDYWSLYSYFR